MKQSADTHYHSEQTGEKPLSQVRGEVQEIIENMVLFGDFDEVVKKQDILKRNFLEKTNLNPFAIALDIPGANESHLFYEFYTDEGDAYLIIASEKHCHIRIFKILQDGNTIIENNGCRFRVEEEDHHGFTISEI